MSEKRIQSEIMLAIGRIPDVRVFRNQVGVGWVGRAQSWDPRTRVALLNQAYRVTMGLHVGSSDLIGWRRRVITPADVGKTFAQFLSVEVKTPTGRTSDAQDHWIETVNHWGGLAFVTRSAEDAKFILR